MPRLSGVRSGVIPDDIWRDLIKLAARMPT